MSDTLEGRDRIQDPRNGLMHIVKAGNNLPFFSYYIVWEDMVIAMKEDNPVVVDIYQSEGDLPADKPVGTPAFVRGTKAFYVYDVDETWKAAEAAPDLTKESISTGIIYGGEITINADNTKFDIAAGKAVFVDSYTDPQNPTFTEVEWTEQLGLTVDNLNTQLVTFVSVENNNESPLFTQSNVSQSAEDNREKVELGVLVHDNLTNISKASSLSNWTKDTDLKVLDLAGAIGRINIGRGNKYGPNGANLQINRTAGKMLAINGNYGNNKKLPNTIQSAAETAITFKTAYGDSGSVVGQSNVIDTTNYNPLGDGGLVEMPDGAVTTHGIFFSPETGLTIVHYGQFLYDSIKKAIDSWEQEEYNVIPELEGVSLRGVLAFKKGATDLSDPTQAKFINPGAFGFINNKTVPTYSRYGETVELIDALSYQRQSLSIVEDTGNLYLEVEATGGGNIVYVFGQREYVLNCTTGPGTSGKARIQLTLGASFSSPTLNYVYVIRQNDEAILQVSSNRPTGEFAYLAKILLPDLTTYQSEGAYTFQPYTDAKEFDGRSAVQRTNERLRVFHADYEPPGMLQTVTIDTVPSPDSVDLSITAGQAWQKHLQTTPALQVSVNGIYIVNHPTTPWLKITDLNDPEALQTSDGTSLAGRRFNWVIGVLANYSNNDCKLLLNLPNDDYGTDSGALADANKTAVTTFPSDLKGVVLLNARLPIRHQTAGGGQYTNLAALLLSRQVIDLRGQIPGVDTGGGGAIPSANVFPDDLFRIYDNATLFEMAFELAALTANRTYNTPDRSGTLALTDGIGSPYDLGFAMSDEDSDLTTDNKGERECVRAQTLESLTLYLNEAPAGSSLVCEVYKNTTLIQTITIPAASLTVTVANTTSFAVGDRIKGIITQVGTTTPGKGAKLEPKSKLA